VIAKDTGATPPPVPDVAPPIAIAPFKLTEAVSLWDSLPKAIESDKPLTMEDIGQNYGWMLYRTRLSVNDYNTGMLTVHDYACAYSDRKPVTVDVPYAKITSSRLAVGAQPCRALDRRLGQASLNQNGGTTAQTHADTDPASGAQDSFWDLLVENSGRINYSHQLRTDRKGIVVYAPPATRLAPVKWFIYPLPMTNPSALHFKKTLCLGPCFYRGSFNVDQPGDTFLDTSELTKGQLWVNGHALGRFWNIGPQRTLYLPGPWLRKGANEVILFDMDARMSEMLEGLTKPNLGD